MKFLPFSFLFLFLCSTLFAQNTIGTLQNDPESFQGYTFFSPFSGTKAFLVDNCGRLVNEWDRGTQPGLSAYFLENGLLFRTYKVSPEGPFTSASNAGGLELVDWENNTVWAWELNTPTQLSHHDAVYLPNGNILVLSWELVYENELIELGRNPDEIAPQGYMWSERILELQPTGSNGANIIWEWRMKDHYVQDFDPTKQNFGIIAEHPELFDINLPQLNSSNSNSPWDWNHFNAIDYNAALDQIVVSTRNSDEIWILDHSTTTQEAAGHSGGLYGKGGDILYRWGNASAYDRAPVSEQRLFGQHGVHWIPAGLEDAGKIMIYNNGNERPGTDYSTVEIISPPQTVDGGYQVPATQPFGPVQAEWSYGNLSDENFFSQYLSNAQRLPNGNTLINAGSPGYIFEITPARAVVWAYEIPLNGDFPGVQGQSSINNNATFRAYRYGPFYPGLEGKDLSPGTTIETGTDLSACLTTVSADEKTEPGIWIQYLPATHELLLAGEIPHRTEIRIMDLTGQIKLERKLLPGSAHFALPDLPVGIYLVQVGQTVTKIFFR